MGRDDINGAPWILPPGTPCPAAQLGSADSPPANEHPQLYVRVGRILASPRCRVATPRWQLTSLPRWHPTLSPFQHEEWQHTGRQLIILSDSTKAPVKICFVTSGAIGDCGRSRLLSVVRGHSLLGPLAIEDLPVRPCGLLRRPTPPHSQDMRRPTPPLANVTLSPTPESQDPCSLSELQMSLVPVIGGTPPSRPPVSARRFLAAWHSPFPPARPGRFL